MKNLNFLRNVWLEVRKSFWINPCIHILKKVLQRYHFYWSNLYHNLVWEFYTTILKWGLWMSRLQQCEIIDKMGRGGRKLMRFNIGLFHWYHMVHNFIIAKLICKVIHYIKESYFCLRNVGSHSLKCSKRVAGPSFDTNIIILPHNIIVSLFPLP